MKHGFLLGRTPLWLSGDGLALHNTSPGDLSAVASTETSAGRVLWLGGDEAFGIGRNRDAAKEAGRRNAILTLHDDGIGGYRLIAATPLRDVLPQVTFREKKNGDEEEIDIEGFDLAGDRLWLVGSHSTKRKKPDNGDGRRLRKVKVDLNRFLLAWVTVRDGALITGAAPNGEPLSAALLPMRDDGGNPLTDALMADRHLAPFVHPMASAPGEDAQRLHGKDNGFDIEGLAVREDRVYLGLRGPVLRGWAVILVVEPKPGDTPGSLRLGKVGHDGPRVAKHFVYLRGMGIRDLCFDGDDLLILAGPTMDVDGIAAVWRLDRPDQLADGSLTGEPPGEASFDADRLHHLFDLPMAVGADRAEGLVRFDQWGERAVMVVYDAAAKDRLLPHLDNEITDAVLADVFRLPRP